MVGAELASDGCFLCDGHQRTSVTGLYAAGDVVHGLDQISHAMGEGGVAATTIRNDLCSQSPRWREPIEEMEEAENRQLNCIVYIIHFAYVSPPGGNSYAFAFYPRHRFRPVALRLRELPDPNRWPAVLASRHRSPRPGLRQVRQGKPPSAATDGSWPPAMLPARSSFGTLRAGRSSNNWRIPVAQRRSPSAATVRTSSAAATMATVRDWDLGRHAACERSRVLADRSGRSTSLLTAPSLRRRAKIR